MKRPVVRYFGGKYLSADRIIAHFPPHRIYVEPFGGAASVLLQKPRCYAEVYNDIDDEIVNLFRILRDPAQASELKRRLLLTPFSRTELKAAYAATQSPLSSGDNRGVSDSVELARFTIIKSFMGFGSNSIYKVSGFRADNNRAGTTPAHDWMNYPRAIAEFTGRLSGVVIEHRPATLLMRTLDRADCLHYVDPPYPFSTRGKASRYRHEMSEQDHAELLSCVTSLSGMVVLSTYPNRQYTSALREWQQVEFTALADCARKRTEVLFLNPTCVAALAAQQKQICLL